MYRLRADRSARDLKLGPYGYAENARNSYGQFRTMRDAGKIPAGTRLQVTLPGPGTTVASIEMPGEQILPIARAALAEQLAEIVHTIPARDLTIQLDIGMEAEHEEYLRRPEAFELPIHQVFHWTQDQMADSVAWLANKIPSDVEFGLHVCSIWHHYPYSGQDNAVLVDTANAIIQRLTRPVGYLHMPVIPEHTSSDFATLKNLHLPAGCKFYLGLINLSDGVPGARQRVEAAQAVVSDFGVAFFCGLGHYPSGAHAAQLVPPTHARATPETIGQVLDLHQQVAAL